VPIPASDGLLGDLEVITDTGLPGYNFKLARSGNFLHSFVPVERKKQTMLVDVSIKISYFTRSKNFA
jgi:hypothetical protein